MTMRPHPIRKSLAISLRELVRFLACIATVLLWFALGLLCLPGS
jgi:hypothetical protein